jgi:hypothetical protein
MRRANYYNAHKAEFNLLEPQYHLAQIQVTDPGLQPPATCRTTRPPTTKTRKKIQAIKNRIDAGEDFGAARMPTSPSARTPLPMGRHGLRDRVADEGRPRHLRRHHQAQARRDHGSSSRCSTPTRASPSATPSTSSSARTPPASATSPIPACSRPSASSSTTAARSSSRPPTTKCSTTRPRSKTTSQSKSSRTQRSKTDSRE